ncbi:MAG: aminopeptidase P family N-terminal domain-containing protein, partial [Duodenibacillus sp.]|nr:aminopeptidase P family N-terminal domain-containing protein [Duodenibacillus sp.]
MEPSAVSARLARLRQLMAERGLAAWIALTSDPHASEYVGRHWAFRRWLSGFRSSAGTLVVTAGEALLWTDSRYWEQAARQLDPAVALMKQGEEGVPAPEAWLAARLAPGDRAGCDAGSVPAKRFEEIAGALAERGAALADDPGLVDALWTGRPPLPSDPVEAFETAQEPRAAKLARLREAVAREGAQAHALSTL